MDKNLFQINAVLLNCLFTRKSWKKRITDTKKNIKQQNCFFNIDNNNTSFPEQQIILHAMISEEPCDTEDWSIFRTENKILPFWNKLH